MYSSHKCEHLGDFARLLPSYIFTIKINFTQLVLRRKDTLCISGNSIHFHFHLSLSPDNAIVPESELRRKGKNNWTI